MPLTMFIPHHMLNSLSVYATANLGNIRAQVRLKHVVKVTQSCLCATVKVMESTSLFVSVKQQHPLARERVILVADVVRLQHATMMMFVQSTSKVPMAAVPINPLVPKIMYAHSLRVESRAS